MMKTFNSSLASYRAHDAYSAYALYPNSPHCGNTAGFVVVVLLSVPANSVVRCAGAWKRGPAGKSGRGYDVRPCF